MAKKTDAELGKMIRDAVSAMSFTDKETVVKLRISLGAEVVNSDTSARYSKGSKGRTLDKYNQTDETIVDEW